MKFRKSSKVKPIQSNIKLDTDIIKIGLRFRIDADNEQAEVIARNILSFLKNRVDEKEILSYTHTYAGHCGASF